MDGIRTGGLDEDGALEAAVAEADWVLEAIVERLEPKRALFERLEPTLTDTTRFVTTNTSGLSIAALAEGRSDAFRRRFAGTHFFNPPRYTRLLELIPLGDTDPAILAELGEFASRQLGKGTVVARDTPAFIANRLGTHGLMVALRLAQELGLGPDEVDELTGPLIGRPKSATFRTLDLVGIDVATAVADHCHTDLTEDPERETFAVPAVMRGLVERGALGEKSGAGFYRKEGGEILALDLERGEYRPRRPLASAAVQMARSETDLAARLRMLIAAEDTAGEFLRRALASNLGYAARIGPEIAVGVADVDAAMRLGFEWELGPFQTLDALGDAARLLPEVQLPIPAYHNGSAWSFVARSMRPLEALGGQSTPRGSPGGPAGQLGGLGRRARRRDPGAGAPRQAQHHRPRHDRHDRAGRGPCRRALRRAGDRHRGARLQRRREPGAHAHRGRGGRVGRARPRHPPLPGRDAGHPPRPGAGGRRAARSHTGRRCRARPGCLPCAAAGRDVHRPGGAGRRPHPCRRRVDRDGAAHRRTPARRSTGDLFPLYSHVFTAVASATVATSAWEAREYLYFTDADAITANPDRQWADAARCSRAR